ncbi:tyrosine-type recombinase/integrase [Kineosporia rhizophila]|uniref:tyrosine-type recombinase/integrase n=1 Tax=Kineosporia TaxID=49184 RepID=UPI000AA4477B|nr:MULTISPECIES: tyrosine-type recombinase/integrase [Kineosporia]MCE0536975.1 tyrosine-type recombinase/integrase [Kineosporia rhizophila]GLY19133.1 hypothetical protein Kisp01_61470 [Kineosporia sp. NBRC 101677]
MNAAWNDGKDYYEDRTLKHRGKQTARRVPAPPELVALLDEHITTYKVPQAGRLFITRTGHSPGRPVSTTTYTRIWRQAREKVLTEAQQSSPLARVPYQLRHACVSLWLNAGVPPTQVAEWAGHSLHVLLKVYAKCIDGEEEQARRRVADALRGRVEARPNAASPSTKQDAALLTQDGDHDD